MSISNVRRHQRPQDRTGRSGAPALRVTSPSEILEVVPYLLGFHPRASVVLVGIGNNTVEVTARLDLADSCAAAFEQLFRAFRGGSVTGAIVAVYTDTAVVPHEALPLAEVADLAAAAAAAFDIDVADAVLVSGGRWWSYLCGAVGCCPPEGRDLVIESSAVAAEATFRGLVALPDRDSLYRSLQPEPDEARERLRPLLDAEESAAVEAVLAGESAKHLRAGRRAVFAAARSGVTPSDDAAARHAVALSEPDVFGAVWSAVDARRVQGRSLWTDLARRLPAPYDAPALLLLGWTAWREGNGALANVAADRALESTPDFLPAHFLVATVGSGVDPRRAPRLGRRRGA